MFKFIHSYIIILARLSDLLSITIDTLNRESVRALRILMGFHGPDQPHQRTPTPPLLMGPGAPSQLSHGYSVPARATTQEYRSAAEPQPCPWLATDAVDPGRDLQTDFQLGPRPASFPQTCLMICTPGWSWLPSPGLHCLGIGEHGWPVLPHSAPGSLSLKEQPVLTGPSHR